MTFVYEVVTTSLCGSENRERPLFADRARARQLAEAIRAQGKRYGWKVRIDRLPVQVEAA